MAAVMTAQIVTAAVVGKRNVAFRASGHKTTAAAHDKGGEASTVQEQYRLLPFSSLLSSAACSLRLNIERLPSFSSSRISTTCTLGSALPRARVGISSSTGEK